MTTATTTTRQQIADQIARTQTDAPIAQVREAVKLAKALGLLPRQGISGRVREDLYWAHEEIAKRGW